jgi:hypothetical protein
MIVSPVTGRPVVPAVPRAAHEHVFYHFYRTPRMGIERLSDGGGPFGFDITGALQIDHLIRGLGCDAVVETGCHVGDTTDFLSATYPHRSVITCDVDPRFVAFTRHRLAGRANVEIVASPSPGVVAEACRRFRRPLFYLDAHWNADWPLEAELRAITHGLVCIDDFDIGHPRFSYDRYGGVECGPRLLAGLGIARCWVNAPDAEYPFPCLQIGRRAGRAFVPVGLDATVALSCPWFEPRSTGSSR